MITSRPEVFTNDSEEMRLYEDFSFSPSVNNEIYRLKLLPFDENKIEKYLQKRLITSDAKLIWTEFRKQIERVDDLNFTLDRPILLEITIKALPQLIKGGNKISLSRIYETYLLTEFERQLVDKNREFLIESNTSRLQLLEIVACNIYMSQDDYGATLDQLFTQLEPEFSNKQKLDVEFLIRDLINCSFMIREGDKYYFSHRSFMEFLVAKRVFHEIQDANAYFLTRLSLGATVLDFLRDMRPDSEIKWNQTLWTWIEELKITTQSIRNIELIDNEENYYDDLQIKSIVLGSNAISILNVAGKLNSIELNNLIIKNAYFQRGEWSDVDLSNTIIVNCYFNKTEFQRIKFCGAKFYNPYFNKNEMSNIDFSDSVIINSYFNGTRGDCLTFVNTKIEAGYFNRSKMPKVEFNGSYLNKIRFNETDLENGDFSYTTIRETRFDKANLRDGNFDNSTLSDCRFDKVDMSRALFNNAHFYDVRIDKSIVTDTIFATADDISQGEE